MSIFFSDKELNLFNSINEELINKVIGQTIILFKVDPEATKMNDLYGEAAEKILSNGFQFNALINITESDVQLNSFGGISVTRRIEVFIQRRALEEKQIVVEEGDFLLWDRQTFEITKVLYDTKILEGLPEFKHTVKLEAVSAENI